MQRVCQRCHACLSEEAGNLSVCPACGGRLMVAPDHPPEGSSAPAETVDHRGIVLPARHAVGGIITPW